MCALPKWLSAGFYDYFALFSVRTRALPMQGNFSFNNGNSIWFVKIYLALLLRVSAKIPKQTFKSVSECVLFTSVSINVRFTPGPHVQTMPVDFSPHHMCLWGIGTYMQTPGGQTLTPPHPPSYLLQLDHACLWQHTTLPCAANRWSALDQGCRPPHIARSCYKMDTLDV